MLDLATKGANPNIREVVDTYFHALFAKFPRNRYYVGSDAKYFVRQLSVLPDNWQDFILKMSAFGWAGGDPKSMALVKK